jgi:DNA-binding CsgD family transcriptional regulator
VTAAVSGAGGTALDRAAAVVRDAVAVDRVSVARIDAAAGTFTIAAESGRPLLPPGTVLPIQTCSYFAGAPDGRVFGEDDFDASSTFRLPFDGVILAAGYHSGCSVPVVRDGDVVGALSLSSSDHRRDMARLPSLLEAVADVLAARLGRAPRLSARERELLGLLDEGLRFKQVARALLISEATAKTHGRNLFRKLGASSRSEAVHLAREAGLLTSPPVR